MRQGEFLLLPGRYASASALKSSIPIYTPEWREALWEQSVLPEKHNKMSPARAWTQITRSKLRERINHEGTTPLLPLSGPHTKWVCLQGPACSDCNYYLSKDGGDRLYYGDGLVTNSQSDQFPVGLIAQLVKHCIGIADRRHAFESCSELLKLRVYLRWSIMFSCGLLFSIIPFYGIPLSAVREDRAPGGRPRIKSLIGMKENADTFVSSELITQLIQARPDATPKRRLVDPRRLFAICKSNRFVLSGLWLVWKLCSILNKINRLFFSLTGRKQNQWNGVTAFSPALLSPLFEFC